MTGHRILIVDDDPTVLRTLKRTLSDKYDVTEATSLQQGLELLEAFHSIQPYSAILVDQHLGDGYGNNILLEAKHLSPLSVRIIISGADDQLATKEAINQKLVDHYIPKNAEVIDNVLTVCDLATEKYEVLITEQKYRYKTLIEHYQKIVEERKLLVLKHLPTATESVSLFEQVTLPPLSALQAWISSQFEKRYQASIDDFFSQYVKGCITLQDRLLEVGNKEFSADDYTQQNFRNTLHMISTDTKAWMESHALILADILGILDTTDFPKIRIKG